MFRNTAHACSVWKLKNGKLTKWRSLNTPVCYNQTKLKWNKQQKQTYDL